MQVMPFMFAAELLKPAKLAIAEPVIKTERLKTECIEKSVLAATLTGFAFCRTQ